METTDSLDGGGTIDKSDYSTVTLTSQPVRGRTGTETGGRFPANLILDNSEEVRECFPSPHGAGYKREKMVDSTYTASSYDMSSERQMNRFGDSGNASRFFKSIIYQAKASKSERNKGLDLHKLISIMGLDLSSNNPL